MVGGGRGFAGGRLADGQQRLNAALDAALILQHQRQRDTGAGCQRLVGVSSPVAGVAEIHEMKMEGEVMKMRPAGPVELPAGKAVELMPGGLHLMLMDLKQPLALGTSVPVTLVFKDGRGVESRVETQLVVGQSAPGAAPGADGHKH